MAKRTPATSKSPAAAADAIDEQLARYRAMRDFKITAEPSGESVTAAPAKKKTKSTSKEAAPQPSDSTPHLPFVIQKHAASHLHYDFRLGWRGVLKSWAVAKGPSYVTADKRLAVQVEDHPIEYGGFEGIIPKGQYGGGTVMLWDQGTWEPQPGHTDVDEGLRSGSLKFILHGTKMKGKWALIRMGGKAANERKPNWLLIKEHDSFERTPEDPCVTVAEPDSVVTGRNLDQIAHSEDHVWNSKETAHGNAWYRNDPSAAATAKQPPAKASSVEPKRSPTPKAATLPNFAPILASAPKEKLPTFIPPQLALESTAPSATSGWLHELKLDGYRIQARKHGSAVQLLTRTGLDWTHRMQTIAEQIKLLPVESALLDGEVVVLADDGTTSFADLQAAFQEGASKPLTYFVFDLLHLNGHNLRDLTLLERKALLAQVLSNSGDLILLSEHLEADGDAIFHKACELHVEGIVSKRATSRYTSGRSSHWLKRKCVHEQEFVIGGFTLPSNGTHGVGALLLGYYQNKNLIYAGRTGTGFTQKTHRILRDQLDQLRTTSSPFHTPPAEARRGAIWIEPQLVAQVSFATWTADNLLRQAAFKGLREDKPAHQVQREEAAIPPTPRKSPASAKVNSPAQLAAKASSRKSTPATHHAPPPTSASRSKPAAQPPPIRLTHPDKILDPESGLTKQQLADYFFAIAPHMLPYVAGRPLSLVRCPEGSQQPCFYQKHANHMLPPGVESVPVPDKKSGKTEPYITLSTPEALAGLAQMGVLEIHPWGSTNQDLEHPDRIILDLDPDTSIPWSTLAESASAIRKHLKTIGLESFLKTTGGKGLHIVIPIQPQHDWAAIKQFAHAFVLLLEKQQPTLYLTKMSKAARKDRIYLDYLRNERGATAVAAYSPRARAGAPVSLPLSWSDLKLPERPVFPVTQFNVWKYRLTRDPWKQFSKISQRLDLK